jgi:glycosyltransferase involved in cell wall biosynthesis
VISVLELRSVRGTGGGPEKTILAGAERHDRTRFAVTVCYLRDLRDRQFGIDQRARASDVDYVEVAERHSFDPTIWTQLVALARKRRFDIVHGHDHKTDVLALLLARRTGAIPIATAHGWTGQSVRERYVYYPADRRVLRRMARVIAVSSDIRAQLVRTGTDPSRITVLLNGIDAHAFKRDPARREPMRRALGCSPGNLIIGAVGRLEPQKRFDLLLEAFGAVRAHHPAARLVVAGEGSLRGSLERLAERLGIANACRFLGHRLDIADLHQAFDLFVQSSEYEGTPNAALEAMAMETPLVATDVGGTSELVTSGVHGIIVPPRDTSALTGAIDAVFADPAAATARATTARERIENELSFAQRTRKLEEIYDEVMEARQSRYVASVSSHLEPDVPVVPDVPASDKP